MGAAAGLDRLLRPNRWIVFDDVEWSFADSPTMRDAEWSFADSPTMRDAEWVQAMSEDERNEHQVLKVIDLLVRTTPGYQVRLFGNVVAAFKGPPDAPELQQLTSAAGSLLHELAVSMSR